MVELLSYAYVAYLLACFGLLGYLEWCDASYRRRTN